MRLLSCPILVCVVTSALSAEEVTRESNIPPLKDPRPPIYRTFSNGVEGKQVLTDCFVIIAWKHPAIARQGCQIWGDDRLLTKGQLVESLRNLYDATAEWEEHQPHLLVVGNDWGAGRELDSALKKLSEKHKIDTFYFGGSHAFDKADFKDEDERRARLISAAIEKGIDSAGKKTDR